MLLFLNRNCYFPNILDLFCRTSSIHRYSIRSSITTSKTFYTKHFRIELQKNAFSPVGTSVWNEIHEKIEKIVKKSFNKEMTNVLPDPPITEDDFIETEKIVLNLKKSYIYDLYIAIFFCILHVMLFLIYLRYVLYPLLIL